MYRSRQPVAFLFAMILSDSDRYLSPNAPFSVENGVNDLLRIQL